MSPFRSVFMGLIYGLGPGSRAGGRCRPRWRTVIPTIRSVAAELTTDDRMWYVLTQVLLGPYPPEPLDPGPVRW